MIELLGDLKGVQVYIDNILISTESREENIKLTKEVLKRLIKAKLTISPKKCKFLQNEMYILRHIINKDRINVD